MAAPAIFFFLKIKFIKLTQCSLFAKVHTGIRSVVFESDEVNCVKASRYWNRLVCVSAWTQDNRDSQGRF